MFDYILLADITNDTRLAAAGEMSLSITSCWQLARHQSMPPANGSGHPSVKPFSTPERGGVSVCVGGGDGGVADDSRLARSANDTRQNRGREKEETLTPRVSGDVKAER